MRRLALLTALMCACARPSPQEGLLGPRADQGPECRRLYRVIGLVCGGSPPGESPECDAWAAERAADTIRPSTLISEQSCQAAFATLLR